MPLYLYFYLYFFTVRRFLCILKILKFIVFSISIPGSRFMSQNNVFANVILAGTFSPVVYSGRLKTIGKNERPHCSFGSNINEMELSVSVSWKPSTFASFPDAFSAFEEDLVSISCFCPSVRISSLYALKSCALKFVCAKLDSTANFALS